ncbi:MAG: DUF167 domain-containing protein [Planctomycetota bacterium]|nr:MAG: DUF167 domain-containing protein [Planctomycetota bacterium]
MLRLVTENNAVLLPVKVVPGASRTALKGFWQDRLKVAVAAPPEKGKANDALVAFLARLLGVRRRDVTVAAGTTTPLKTVRIEGITEADVHQALQSARS